MSKDNIAVKYIPYSMISFIVKEFYFSLGELKSLYDLCSQFSTFYTDTCNYLLF